MFGSIGKKAALLGAALGIAFASGANAQELKLGANIGNVPWQFQDAKGDFVGFEIDLANEVAKRLGMKVKVVNIPFNGLFAAVQSGQIDAAVSSITITKKRLESVSFAQPYYDSDQSLSVAAASGIKDLAGMSGKVVGVDTGSTGDMWASQNKDKHKFKDIRRYEGLAPAMLDLAAGRIDGYISDIPAVQYYVRDKPAYKVVERIPTGEQYSMMFAKDAPLAAKVDAEITKLKAEGFIAGLHEKWFGAKADANTTTVKPAPMPKL
ncbi:MAG: transporter substrate-binding domain-containing protein [Proteobacteria bacterium]|nr:transporter substrate-binding domain-containing protein [Pseudomonadota bacterium]